MGKRGEPTNPKRPKTGEENYEPIKQVWNNENFDIMRDFLKYYNCLDVQPLHDAVKNLIHIYKHGKYDLLKEILTLSGAANKILHRFNRGSAIFRFGEKHKILYDLVRKQIIGGPSSVFSRYEKVNKSFIGENENN